MRARSWESTGYPNKAVTSVAEAVNAYCAFLKRRDKAPATLQKYRAYLADFSAWAGRAPPGRDLELRDRRALPGRLAGALRGALGALTLRTLQARPDGALSAFYGFLERFSLLVDGEGRQVGNPMLAIEAHRLRRAFGSRLYQDGLPLDRVSMVLGHADTRTTELYYARLRYDQVRREMLVLLNGRS